MLLTKCHFLVSHRKPNFNFSWDTDPLVITVRRKHLIQEQRITGVTLVKYEGGNVTQSGKAQKKSFRSCTYLHLQNWVKSDPIS